jgi:hypothetical protein
MFKGTGDILNNFKRVWRIPAPSIHLQCYWIEDRLRERGNQKLLKKWTGNFSSAFFFEGDGTAASCNGFLVWHGSHLFTDQYMYLPTYIGIPLGLNYHTQKKNVKCTKAVSHALKRCSACATGLWHLWRYTNTIVQFNTYLVCTESLRIQAGAILICKYPIG